MAVTLKIVVIGYIGHDWNVTSYTTEPHRSRIELQENEFSSRLRFKWILSMPIKKPEYLADKRAGTQRRFSLR